MRLRRAAWGAAAVLAYLSAAWLSSALGLVGPRVLFDGLAPPPPYRWMDPPKEFKKDNQKPESGRADVAFGPDGTMGRSVATDDGQFVVTLPTGTFPAREGERAVNVRIDAVAPPDAVVPDGLRIDGNAYRVRAAYVPSGASVDPAKPVTVVIRYPRDATRIVRLDGKRWVALETTPSPQSLQLFGDSPVLGTFAAAGPPIAGSRSTPKWAFVAVGAAVLVAGALLQRRLRRPRYGRGRTPGGRRRQQTRADRRRRARRHR